MGDDTLSAEELDSLLAGAEIISDPTGSYTVADQNEVNSAESEELEEEIVVDQAAPPPAHAKQGKGKKAPQVSVEDVEVGKFTLQQKHNTGLLLDIYVQITVELGRTILNVKDILGLGEGSIVELNKAASEPVDLLVNNRLLARGEVVVIDENFGARVTNIVNPMDKISANPHI